MKKNWLFWKLDKSKKKKEKRKFCFPMMEIKLKNKEIEIWLKIERRFFKTDDKHATRGIVTIIFWTEINETLVTCFFLLSNVDYFIY